MVGFCFPEFSFVKAYVRSTEHVGLQGSKRSVCRISLMTSEVLDIINLSPQQVCSLFLKKEAGNCFIGAAATTCLIFALQHCVIWKGYRTHCMEAGSIGVQGVSIWLIEARYKCI